jgi:hypothetical protein
MDPLSPFQAPVNRSMHTTVSVCKTLHGATCLVVVSLTDAFWRTARYNITISIMNTPVQHSRYEQYNARSYSSAAKAIPHFNVFFIGQFMFFNLNLHIVIN